MVVLLAARIGVPRESVMRSWKFHSDRPIFGLLILANFDEDGIVAWLELDGHLILVNLRIVVIFVAAEKLSVPLSQTFQDDLAAQPGVSAACSADRTQNQSCRKPPLP